MGVAMNSARPYPSSLKRYMTPSIGVRQCGEHAKHLLDRFNAAVGGIGFVNGPYKARKDNWSSYYHLTIKGHSKVQAAIAMLWPFLGPAKRAQANKILSEWLASLLGDSRGNSNPLFAAPNQ